jgi:hypothetical protein
MTRIEIEVDGTVGTAVLRDEIAPKTIAAIVAALPVEGTARHVMWSGRACTLEVPIAEAPAEQEHPVCSIYPGHLVWDRDRLIVAYGASEYRSTLGVQYATLLGRLDQNRDAVIAALERMHDGGDTPFRIRPGG